MCNLNCQQNLNPVPYVISVLTVISFPYFFFAFKYKHKVHINLVTSMETSKQIQLFTVAGLEIRFFFRGPALWVPAQINPEGPNKSSVAQIYIFICRAFEKNGGPSGPQHQKPEGNLENPGENGPRELRVLPLLNYLAQNSLFFLKL